MSASPDTPPAPAHQPPIYPEIDKEAMLQADPELVSHWIKGWALARDTPLPLAMHGGWHVDVGMPEERTRYVFPCLQPAITALAHTINEPRILLKVCASPSALQAILPAPWIIHRLGYMMTLEKHMHAAPTLPDGYAIDIQLAQPMSVVRVLTANGEVAASGRIVLADGIAVYDNIETHTAHQRRGLGSIIMKQLEAIAAGQAIQRGILVATAEGRALYTSLGWELHTLYTTAAIPALT